MATAPPTAPPTIAPTGAFEPEPELESKEPVGVGVNTILEDGIGL